MHPEWVRLSFPNSPSKRSEGIACFYHPFIYIWSGRDQEGKCLDDLYQYDTRNHQWKQIIVDSNEKPIARYGHSVVVWNTYAFVFGGDDGKRSLNNTFRFSFETLEWKEIKPKGTLPNSRYYHSAVLNNNTMLIYGGTSGYRNLYFQIGE